MKGKRGFTLLELLVAMGLLGALATFFVTLIVEFNRLACQQAEWSGMTEESFKLAATVREDVRQAESVSVQGALVLGLPGGHEVRYVLEDGKLKRRETAEGTRKVEYEIRCETAQWEIAPGGRLVRGELVLAAAKGGEMLSTFPMTILAARTKGAVR